jgi:predicted dehydrogenase
MSQVNPRIRVGVVGASIDRGWGSMAHIPALRSLPEFEVTAVCTTKQTSADAVARHFNIPLAFADPASLAEHPDVDLVAVTARAPGHFAIVEPTIAAGKAAYCEWPIGKSFAETLALQELATKKGVRIFAGLQARNAPEFRYARDLIARGHIGRVLSANLLSTAGAWGSSTSNADSYNLDESNGATLLSVWTGHTIDTLTSILGPFDDVSALISNGRGAVKIIETGESRSLRAPDDVIVNARFESGATAAVHLRGGPQAGTCFRLEILGTSGMITVTADGIFAMVLSKLTVMCAQGSHTPLVPVNPPPEYYSPTSAGLLPHVLNVAETYSLIAKDLKNGTSVAASIAVGVELHRWLDAMARAAASGCRASAESPQSGSR